MLCNTVCWVIFVRSCCLHGQHLHRLLCKVRSCFVMLPVVVRICKMVTLAVLPEYMTDGNSLLGVHCQGFICTRGGRLKLWHVVVACMNSSVVCTLFHCGYWHSFPAVGVSQGALRRPFTLLASDTPVIFITSKPRSTTCHNLMAALLYMMINGCVFSQW